VSAEPGAAAAPPSPTRVAHLDGSATDYFPITCTQARLLALLREIFEEHWADVIFGPCIEGAVFEGRFAERPRVTLLDGYVTVQIEGRESWHFHLCIGPHAGSPELPTPPALAKWRRCARAAFFQSRDRAGRPSAWGVRLWNGRDEQMLTIFFPNPWIDPARGHYVGSPDWSRLRLWMDLRARHAGVSPEPPPVDATPPRTH
jgi:hypothetical protein